MGKAAIVIGSTTKTSDWLDNCLKSFGDYKKYPIIVVVNDDFELGKLRWVYENTLIDDIFLMHDSVEVKDPSFFDTVFESQKSVAITNHPCPFGMFFGKYQRKYLDMIDIPETKTKLSAVEQEMVFNGNYASVADYFVLFPEFKNQPVFEQKFGRKNMVLENRCLKKYKGTWSRGQLKV